MRHGDAQDGIDDAARRLSDEGIEEARAAGRFLARIREVPSVIWHSTLVRARETAELVRGSMGSALDVMEVRGVHPGGDPEEFAKSLRGLDFDLMVVTHMPFAGRLVRELTGGDARFTTGTVSCLERRRAGGEWSMRFHASSKLIARS